CCLRANENPRPLRCLIFRGSIPHPMQSLCTLRNHCRQWPRNTRYQADATPYLGRTSTGRIAPALPGALILIPDISGFTGFTGATEIDHAAHIITELLELIVASNETDFTLAEIEGDAVLFYRKGEPLR